MEAELQWILVDRNTPDQRLTQNGKTMFFHSKRAALQWSIDQDDAGSVPVQISVDIHTESL